MCFSELKTKRREFWCALSFLFNASCVFLCILSVKFYSVYLGSLFIMPMIPFHICNPF
ncbi:hypothetical protein Lalb_Chr19g0127951 [Lupinus albus]|uniref:Uncharacterized protein n=1 Tax=Lupinus albus TaxID=3870 RepID=A0A6A4NY89_LUPAL|nr:hypothetical protein Lalb_Chr19g0127951 [Lupinus albus]